MVNCYNTESIDSGHHDMEIDSSPGKIHHYNNIVVLCNLTRP